MLPSRWKSSILLLNDSIPRHSRQPALSDYSLLVTSTRRTPRMPQSLFHAMAPHMPQQRMHPKADQTSSATHISHTLRGEWRDDSDKFFWHMYVRMGISRGGCLLLSAVASMVMVAMDSPPADNNPPLVV